MRQLFLFIAWLIALISMLSTLYGSEVMHLPICHLCWYQRICYYPLIIILGVGAYQDDPRAIVYGLPLSILGTLFAVYQTLLQWFPQLESIGVCGQGPSCSDVYMKLFGFVTYPLLSMLTGTTLTILLTISHRYRQNLSA